MIEPTDLLLTAPAVLAGIGAGFYAGQRWAKGRVSAPPKAARPVAEVPEPVEEPDEEAAAEARSLVSQRRAGVPLAELAADAEDPPELPALPVSVTVPPTLARALNAGLPKPLPPAEAIKVLEEAAPGGQIHVPADWPEERRAELGADPEARAEHIAELLSDMSDALQDEADAELAAKLRAEEDAAAAEAERMARPKKKKPARTLPIVRREAPAPAPTLAPSTEAPSWVKWNDPSMLAATTPAEVAPAAPDCDPPEIPQMVTEPATHDAGHEPICVPMAPHYDLPEPAPSVPAYEPPAPSYDPPSYDSGSSSSYDSGGGGGFSGGE